MPYTTITATEVAQHLLRVGNATRNTIQIIADLNAVSVLDVLAMVKALQRRGCINGVVIYRSKLLDYLKDGKPIERRAAFVPIEELSKPSDHRKGDRRTVREDEPQDYTPAVEVARYMQVCRGTIYKWVKQGCPSKYEKGQRLLCPPEVRCWLLTTKKKCHHR